MLRDRMVLERFAQGYYGGAEVEYERAFPEAERYRGIRVVGR